MKTIDLVVPCYNEEDVLRIFYQETDKVVRQISGYSFRYLLVDDGSRDKTLSGIKELAASHPEVKYLSFSVGILGEYISRIYMETKNRPIYILKQTNLEEERTDEGKNL